MQKRTEPSVVRLTRAVAQEATPPRTVVRQGFLPVASVGLSWTQQPATAGQAHYPPQLGAQLPSDTDVFLVPPSHRETGPETSRLAPSSKESSVGSQWA